MLGILLAAVRTKISTVRTEEILIRRAGFLPAKRAAQALH
jgi:hypothetical protein